MYKIVYALKRLASMNTLDITLNGQ